MAFSGFKSWEAAAKWYRQAYEASRVALRQYGSHNSACEIDETDFCTCGLRQARSAPAKEEI